MLQSSRPEPPRLASSLTLTPTEPAISSIQKVGGPVTAGVTVEASHSHIVDHISSLRRAYIIHTTMTRHMAGHAGLDDGQAGRAFRRGGVRVVALRSTDPLDPADPAIAGIY